MKLKNDRFIRALLNQPVDKTPCWIMRQAGRYLPEYKKTRQLAGNFMALCQTPELACEVTLQPLRRFDLDAAILFSDILTIPDAMGLGLTFVENEGPLFLHPISTEEQIKNLPLPDPEVELKYVMDAVRLIKRELDYSVPLIGFSGSPWTLATYMIEGKGSKEFAKSKGLMFSSPKLMHQLLDKLSIVVTDYLNAQIKAGVQAVQIFDTWGGVLSKTNYLEFSLYYMKKIINGLIKNHNGQQIPVTIFTKGGGAWLEEMANSGANCIGLDWMTEISFAKNLLKDKVALQGNMDPCVLYGSYDTIEKEVQKILMNYASANNGIGKGHVFNLGHGIHQQIDPDKVKFMIDAVHNISVSYHSV